MTDSAAPLTITRTESGIAVVGEIDAHTAPAVAAALAAAEHEPLVIDLSGVEFVDSSGLRVLLEAHQTRQAAGGSLVLSQPSPAVQRVLDVSGVDEYLDVSSQPDV
ncbi:MAG TPA: STAS domain-containing protein [Ilumatobacter sp.]|nr:STAS domain-containing protein [Ilumatobacter sp.]